MFNSFGKLKNCPVVGYGERADRIGTCSSRHDAMPSSPHPTIESFNPVEPQWNNFGNYNCRIDVSDEAAFVMTLQSLLNTPVQSPSITFTFLDDLSPMIASWHEKVLKCHAD